MSDDRLFASNNAIGRKWYYVNIFILTLIAYGTQYLFTSHIIPNVVTEVYDLIAKGMLYFLYLIFLITFFSLIDRRLFDICGTRETKGYKNISSILKLAVFFQILALYCQYNKPPIQIPYELIELVAIFMDVIFLIIVFVLGLIKGQISCLSYDEYRKRSKYQ